MPVRTDYTVSGRRLVLEDDVRHHYSYVLCSRLITYAMNSYFATLGKFADFSGRATRFEYWIFQLINVVAVIVLSVIETLLGEGTGPGELGILASIFCLAMVIPSSAVLVRRLHDTDQSGWYALNILIPICNLVLIIFFLVLCSDPTENRYGPPSKISARDSRPSEPITEKAVMARAHRPGS